VIVLDIDRDLDVVVENKREDTRKWHV
jgi:hypothetical protein